MSEIVSTTRRGFLRMLAGAGVVAAANPVHFLPPIGGWSSEVIAAPSFHYHNFVADDLFEERKSYTIGQYADYLSIHDFALDVGLDAGAAHVARALSSQLKYRLEAFQKSDGAGLYELPKGMR